MLITALALSMAFGNGPAAGGSSTPQPEAAEQRVTFGMQCRFDDGLRVDLVATRQDNRFILSRQLGAHQYSLVYMTLDGHGGVTIEDEHDPAVSQAWRDAYADLKKLPLETIRGDEIQAFIAKKDVAPCGHKSFFWRAK